MASLMMMGNKHYRFLSSSNRIPSIPSTLVKILPMYSY